MCQFVQHFLTTVGENQRRLKWTYVWLTLWKGHLTSSFAPVTSCAATRGLCLTTNIETGNHKQLAKTLYTVMFTGQDGPADISTLVSRVVLVVLCISQFSALIHLAVTTLNGFLPAHTFICLSRLQSVLIKNHAFLHIIESKFPREQTAALGAQREI